MSDLVLIQPELAVRDVVESSLATLLSTPTVLDYLVSGLSVPDQDSIRSALAARSDGMVRLGFALENIEDYSVMVSLPAANQAAGLLGDTATGIEEDLIAMGVLTATVSAAEPAVLAFSVVPTGIGTKGTVRIDDEVAVYAVSGSTVTLTNRGVRGTTAAAHAVGASAVFHGISQAIGWPETAQVRVDVLSTNALFTAVVGHMLRAFLVRRRDDFAAQGLTLQGINESDLAPRPADWPAQFYARTLIATIQYTMAIPESFLAITDVAVDVTVETTAGVQVTPEF